ncbi:archaeosortase/exosortase family protein [Rhodococcus aetherivorans]
MSTVTTAERAALFAHTSARWTVIVAATVLGYWSTWEQLLTEISRGTGGGYVLLVPPFAVLAAEGVTRRRRGELPIHDRQTDRIVGGAVLLIALAVKWLLLPRYGPNYQMMHLDVLSAWTFVIGACVLLFGLRVASRYWPVWLLLLGTSPLFYRAVLVQLGGTKFAAGFLMVLLGAIAIAVAVGRTRRRALIGFSATMLLGLALLFAVTTRYPDARVAVAQIVPSGTAALVVGGAFYLYRYRGLAPRTLPRTRCRRGRRRARRCSSSPRPRWCSPCCRCRISSSRRCRWAHRRAAPSRRWSPPVGTRSTPSTTTGHEGISAPPRSCAGR